MEKARALIDDNAVMVFSKSYCPYCRRVKELLKSLGVRFKVVELDEAPDGDQVQAALTQLTGASTVPQVFIKGERIGGCDDTVAQHAQGKLLPKLVSAGAV